MATVRLGPQEIRDPQLRNRAVAVERVQFTGVVWSAPGRILYLQALAQGEPSGCSIEMQAQEAIALYELMGARLREAGYVK